MDILLFFMLLGWIGGIRERAHAIMRAAAEAETETAPGEGRRA